MIPLRKVKGTGRGISQKAQEELPKGGRGPQAREWGGAIMNSGKSRAKREWYQKNR